MGDFYSHIEWGYADTNDDGEAVEEWAEDRKLSLIHDPSNLTPSTGVGGRGDIIQIYYS